MKNLILLLLIFILSSCGITGSTLLGPTYTGLKTGSVYQTSLSYSSSKIVNSLKSSEISDMSFIRQFSIKKKPNLSNIPYTDINPKIVLAYIVNSVEISEVTEPEPLP